MTRDQAAEGRRLGGMAVRQKQPPATCPRCGASMAGRTWHSYLGHLGMHGLADRYFGGDFERCQRHCMENGWARGDSFPENGAFRPYVPVAEISRRETT